MVVGNLIWQNFYKAATEIIPDLEEKISKFEFKEEFREYLGSVEKLSELEVNKKTSSMDILMTFLDPEKKMYKGIENVMSVLARAAMMMSVEAVVEGWVSVMEHHSSKHRNLSENTMLDEVIIAINGPEVRTSRWYIVTL